MEAGPSARERTLTGSRALFCIALVPFGTGLAAHLYGRVAGSTAQAAVVSAETPPVVFDQYLVDLGAVKDSPTVYGWFRFRNVSDRPIHVRKLHPSCGCLDPQLGKHDYLPGEVGEFYLRVQTANQTSGQHEYTVGFEYDQPPEAGRTEPETARLETVTFRVTLPERKVTIEPKGLAFYQLNETATTREIVVRDFRPEPLRVLRATCASKLVEIELDDAVEELGHRAQTIHVTVAGSVPDGTTHETIEIHTDDETQPILRFPLLLRGPEPTGVIRAGHSDSKTSAIDTENGDDSIPLGGDRPAP